MTLALVITTASSYQVRIGPNLIKLELKDEEKSKIELQKKVKISVMIWDSGLNKRNTKKTILRMFLN